MNKLTGAPRKTFMENLGRQYAGTGYYSTAAKGFDALRNFKPFTSLEVCQGDTAAFYLGFEEVQNLRIQVMLAKAKAQAETSAMLKELAEQGMVFSQVGEGVYCGGL